MSVSQTIRLEEDVVKAVVQMIDNVLPKFKGKFVKQAGVCLIRIS